MSKNPHAVPNALCCAAVLFFASFLAQSASGAESLRQFPFTAGTSTPDDKVSQPTATHGEFSSGKPVDVAKAGLIGDGHTDNTEAFRKLLAAPGQIITIPAGDYLTGSITIPSDTKLILQPGVILRDSGHLEPTAKLVVIAGQHIRIVGRGAKIIANRQDYTTGEQRHGIFIYGAKDVIIEGLESSGQGGDGFYIGGGKDAPAQNISLVDCSAKNNRRQGLSITNAIHVDIVDCSFTDTNGTAPQFGIDMEPNEPEDHLDWIRIVQPRTAANAGGGILIDFGRLNSSSPPVDITIVDQRSERERPYLSGRNTSARGIVRYLTSVKN